MSAERKVILWTTSYAELLTGGRVGGIGVQMMFWSKVFSRNGWKVYSLYDRMKPDDNDDCVFLKDKETHLTTFLLYLQFTMKLLTNVKPELVICRGGRNRNLFFIALCCKVFGVKLIQFFGSDADMKKDIHGLSRSVRLNIGLFRLGLKLTKYFVVQNESQRQQLMSQFRGKRSIVIPNIWECIDNHTAGNEEKVILWVGNTRKLKRPQWVFEIAKSFPRERFVIIGGNADKDVYDECIELAKQSVNVDFLGGLPFFETNRWFSKAKILLCTSEYEGFPNTFLQAWSNHVPVLSTVDPSDVIKEQKLGKICADTMEFISCLKSILNVSEYAVIQGAVEKYFTTAHALQPNYDKLMHLLNF